MLHRIWSACMLAVAATDAGAQGFAYNRLDFSNFYATTREDYFPNYTTPGGNVAGDGIFKVYPREIMERGEPHRISGLAIGASVDDGYQGPFSPPGGFKFPDVAIYTTKLVTLGGKEYEVPDVAGGKQGVTFDMPTVALPRDGLWVAQVAFVATHQNPQFRQLLSVPAQSGGVTHGLAVMVLAPVGAKQSDKKAWPVCFPSDSELHRSPGRDAYSGLYDGASGAITMYGQIGAPSNSGELFAQLRFDNPTLQHFSDASGGTPNDPSKWETHMGPGAYSTNLASRTVPGFIGIYCQDQRRDVTQGRSVFCLPLLVGAGAAPNFTTVTVGNVNLRMDPAVSGIFGFWTGLHLGGLHQRYAKEGVAGYDADQTGVYVSPRLPWPAGAAAGISLWTQCVLLDVTSTYQAVGTSNAVRLSIR